MRAAEILKSHNLKRTSCREGIIELIMHARQALSENDIRENLAGNYDRTTFYRSFKTLVESKIIHKIVIDSQVVKYALDTSIFQEEQHAHFFCNECHTVKCMETVLVKKYVLPDGYDDTETDVLIKGICSMCKNHN